MAYLNGKPIFFSPQVHVVTVPEVVQTTGDSETAVMSQKAVTGLFDEDVKKAIDEASQSLSKEIGTVIDTRIENYINEALGGEY